MRYIAKTTFCDGLVGTIFRGFIVEMKPEVAYRYLERGYIEPFHEPPSMLRPAPLDHPEERLRKVMMPEIKEAPKTKRKYTRRKKA